MTLMTLDQVLAATRGQLRMCGPLAQFSGVSTDSRQVQPGDLFVAIRGERHNGHAFLDAARQAGAAGALIEESVPGLRPRHTADGPWTMIEVTDTLYGLGQLAQAYRRRFKLPVIGITGSAGKTTTKEMTAAILEVRHRILKSPGNFNNEIGLPVTLFGLRRDHQAAVLEFGMRGRGQISYLAALARPTIGVITNIGLTHLELLGSQEAIALAKAELLDEMSSQSLAILPADDPFFPLLRAHAPGHVCTVGEDTAADVRVSAVLPDAQGCARFILHTAAERIPVQLQAPGRHLVWNALAAAAAALAAGASAEDVQLGLGRYLPSSGRMHVVTAPGGYTVIDDCYNANPTAMHATLELLAEMHGGKKIAILGDMRELGPTEHALHRAMGRTAMALHLDAVLAVGSLGRDYVEGAADPRAQWYPDHDAVIAAARALLAPGDIVLVKGSRAMQMETIVQALVADA